MIQKLKKSNAGFTLVELIVVIAILGVLAAVLVPQYIGYVEKSRVAVDENAIGEIIHAAEISISEGKVYDDLPAANFIITVANGSVTIVAGVSYATTAAGVTTLTVPGTAVDNDGSELITAMSKVVDAPNFKSNTHGSQHYTISVTVSTDGYSIAPYAVGNWAS